MTAPWDSDVDGRRRWRRSLGGPAALGLGGALAVMAVLTASAAAGPPDRNLQDFANPTGAVRTVSASGSIDTSNPFFQSLGANGRTCATCHVPASAWSISPPEVRARFAATKGLDPIFRTNDGATSPTAAVATLEQRKAAYSLLLSKGLIRVGIGIPAGAEFELAAVDDPYRYASASDLSLFRRPLPSTNLRFLSGVMWDGRETVQPLQPGNSLEANSQALQADLRRQANDATLGHAQATSPLTPQQQQQIVDFELALTTAQDIDRDAGFLAAQDAQGGPDRLATQPFFIGINDPLGNNPSGEAFTPNAMTLYSAWANLSRKDSVTAARQAVARGQALFNTKPITITGVSGLNDELGVGSIQGTCTTCHDAVNVGDHSVAAPLNIGLTDAAQRTPDLPLYTLRNTTTGETVQTTDPGRALITGKWKDIGRFKGPVLRGLAARAPYFHNGSAATLLDAVNFYDRRFQIGFSDQEKSDLVAFLRTL